MDSYRIDVDADVAGDLVCQYLKTHLRFLESDIWYLESDYVEKNHVDKEEIELHKKTIESIKFLLENYFLGEI